MFRFKDLLNFSGKNRLKNYIVFFCLVFSSLVFSQTSEENYQRKQEEKKKAIEKTYQEADSCYAIGALEQAKQLYMRILTLTPFATKAQNRILEIDKQMPEKKD